ncbi:unnamed protein product, partial [marine sediment metagenome]
TRLTVYDTASPGGLVWTHEIASGCDGTALKIRVLLAEDGVAA